MGTPPPPPPPGWYPDPWGLASTRWWDGQRWTEHTQPPAAGFAAGFAPPGGAYQAGQIRELHKRESELWTWARFAIFAWSLLAALESVGAFFGARVFHNEIHTLLFDLRHNQPTSSTSFHGLGFGPTLLFDGAQLVIVCFGIGFLMWQHKAATVARWLGYPSQYSPGWGVAVWFIPIVNLFMPFTALRDLLPPDHQLRPKALPAWLCYIGAGLTNVAIFGVAYFSVAGAVIPLLLALGLNANAVRLGLRLLTGVRDDHEQAVAALVT